MEGLPCGVGEGASTWAARNPAIAAPRPLSSCSVAGADSSADSRSIAGSSSAAYGRCGIWSLMSSPKRPGVPGRYTWVWINRTDPRRQRLQATMACNPDRPRRASGDRRDLRDG